MRKLSFKGYWGEMLNTATGAENLIEARLSYADFIEQNTHYFNLDVSVEGIHLQYRIDKKEDFKTDYVFNVELDGVLRGFLSSEENYKQVLVEAKIEQLGLFISEVITLRHGRENPALALLPLELSEVAMPYFLGHSQQENIYAYLEDNSLKLTQEIDRNTQGARVYPQNFISRYLPYSKGIMLKWRNSLGGWSYWLFSEEYKETIKTKEQGFYQASLLNGNKAPFSVGYSALKVWELKGIYPPTIYELEALKTLLVSEQVYIHQTQINNTESSFNTPYWQKVLVCSTSKTFEQNYHITAPFTVNIQFKN